ncbi:MAG: DNA metabolism protein, partial [Chitinophagaceae bacterium]|nr:DNA metabolism protein [Chitinophagaceae bacterium]
MQTLVYDSSFAGWLTAVFEVYEYKFEDVHIVPLDQRQDSLFGETHLVATCEQKAQRVWQGLRQRVSDRATTQLYRAFLSELKGMENTLLQYVQYAFSRKVSMEYD